MRFGVVGNNLYARMFIKGINAIADCQVVAICPDIEEDTEPLATEYTLKKFKDIESMLQFGELDAVLLASVTSHHAHQIITSLKRGAHVMVDRPMAFSPLECEQVIKCSEETGKIVAVAQVLNYWPEYVKIREIIGSGVLGKLTNISTSRVSGLIDPKWAHRLLNPAWGFGGLEALIHDIDFLNGLWGEPAVVAAQGSLSQEDGYQQAHVLLRYGEINAGLEADYGLPHKYPLSMYFRAVGKNGALQYVFRGGLAKQSSAMRSLTFFPEGGEPETMDVPVYEAFQSQAEDFLRCIKGNVTPTWGNMYQAKTNLQTLVKITDLWRKTTKNT